MILGPGKFLRQFWKAESSYFSMVIISKKITTVFGNEIVIKRLIFYFATSFLKIHISGKFLRQFWKAYHKYFAKITISLPLTLNRYETTIS